MRLIIAFVVYGLTIWFFIGALSYSVKRNQEGDERIDIVAERKPLCKAGLLGPIFLFRTFIKKRKKSKGGI